MFSHLNKHFCRDTFPPVHYQGSTVDVLTALMIFFKGGSYQARILHVCVDEDTVQKFWKKKKITAIF